MWLKRRGYVDTYIEIFTEWNSYVADGELSNREMGLICAKRLTWERQLAEIRDYVRDFRELDPKTVNEPMNGLLTLEQDSIDGDKSFEGNSLLSLIKTGHQCYVMLVFLHEEKDGDRPKHP